MKGFEWVKAKIESQQFSDCKYLEYHLMHSDLQDDDGYPTDEALEVIERWPMFQNKELFEFIHGLWWCPEWGWQEERIEDVTRYNISTAGWSGNESLVQALQHNHNFAWLMTWYQSRRGGHYIFEVKD
jgi:hypothetical protein